MPRVGYGSKRGIKERDVRNSKENRDRFSSVRTLVRRWWCVLPLLGYALAATSATYTEERAVNPYRPGDASASCNARLTPSVSPPNGACNVNHRIYYKPGSEGVISGNPNGSLGDPGLSGSWWVATCNVECWYRPNGCPSCAIGYVFYDPIGEPDWQRVCDAGFTYEKKDGVQTCKRTVTIDKDIRTCPATDNPIQLATGNKFLNETDFASRTLSFTRFYNSRPNLGGANWSNTYSASLDISLGPTISIVFARRPDGNTIAFPLNGAQWTQDADVSERLVQQGNGWLLITAAGDFETYDAAGTLQSTADLAGHVRTLFRNELGQVTSVRDETGRTITLGYVSDGHIGGFTDPAGNTYGYGYDTQGNLISVVYPGGNATVYHYEDSMFVHALTGITDENSVRYASYQYDSRGRAVNEWLAGNVNQNQLTFGYSGTTVKDALNAERYYAFTKVLGTSKLTQKNQPGGSGCGASSSSITYDTNGNVSSRWDFDRHKTTYTHDLTRNLELTRVEGSGTAAARTISTQWHPDWRLETQRAEPKKITTWVYNGQPDPTASNAIASCAPSNALLPDGKPIAVLCKKIEQATTDASGAAGFSATITGTPRTSTWTYNGYGQVLTANGPRTDVADTTTYTYYASTDFSNPATGHTLGDLWKVTNPAGHLTEYLAYDKNGRLLQMKDPNGLVTTLSYTPRGWLKTRQVGTALTTYDYDAVGQLKKVTLPDASWIGYDYDPAHRLVSIYDSLNNRIAYTLDNAGNRTKEDVIDPEGYLVRTQTRVYDALGRLQNLVQPQ